MFELMPFGTNPRDEFKSLMDIFKMPPVFDKMPPHDIKVDVKDLDNEYEVTAALAGVPKENIELKYENDYLTLAIKQEENKEEKDENGKYIRRERHFGQTSRSFYVTGIDKDNIGAEFKDGILKITLPKLDETKKLVSGKIDIK